MCDRDEAPPTKEYPMNEVNYKEATQAAGSFGLRHKLQAEAKQLEYRLFQINQVLSRLTPEVEQTIEVQEQLRRLGIR